MEEEKRKRERWWESEEGIDDWADGIIRRHRYDGKDYPMWVEKAKQKLKRRLRKDLEKLKKRVNEIREETEHAMWEYYANTPSYH